MTVRLAQRGDVPAMVAELQRHHGEHGMSWPFDSVRLSILCAHAIDADNWLALTGPDLLLLARYFDCEFGSGRHALERIVRVPPGQLDAVLAVYERWARDNGCVDAPLGCIRRHAAFARLYARHGYRLAETTFIKTL